jgi:hypothetical protein
MKDQFVPYELAVALKKLGFDEQCLAKYWNDKNLEYNIGSEYKNSEIEEYCVTSPLWQQAFDWFLEKYNLYVHYCYFSERNTWNADIYEITKDRLMNIPMEMQSETYQGIKLIALQKLIEIVKSKK